MYNFIYVFVLDSNSKNIPGINNELSDYESNKTNN